MNAHSLYRCLDNQVQSVTSRQSQNSIPLQIVDMLMGIVIFLIEKLYKRYADKLMVKREIIYRFLIEGDNIRLF